MKKIFLLFVAVLLLATGCGAADGQVEKAAPAGAAQDTQQKKGDVDYTPQGRSTTLIVYFSAMGHTRQLAMRAARVLESGIQEIQPEEIYTEHDLDYNDKTTRATVEQNDPEARPAIANVLSAVEHADTIVLAHPIWWGQEPRIIDTFLESYDLSGKKLVTICTSGGSDASASGEAIAALAEGADYRGSRRFEPAASEDELAAWFREVGVL